MTLIRVTGVISIRSSVPLLRSLTSAMPETMNVRKNETMPKKTYPIESNSV
jgi:hypothetical protein